MIFQVYQLCLGFFKIFLFFQDDNILGVLFSFILELVFGLGICRNVIFSLVFWMGDFFMGYLLRWISICIFFYWKCLFCIVCFGIFMFCLLYFCKIINLFFLMFMIFLSFSICQLFIIYILRCLDFCEVIYMFSFYVLVLQ